jgi:DivIVA domain-containing protein
MPFAPHEIENKRFVVALRGYQTEEVEAFLRAVAADYRAALEEATKSPTEEAHAQLAELRRTTVEQLREERAKQEAEIAEMREVAEREIEAAYAEIARQAEELRRLERSLWTRINVLEHAVVEARQSLSHVSSLEPMQTQAPLATTTLPSVDELLYRVEASLGTETNVELATADL